MSARDAPSHADYELLERVGAGGMAEVFVARQRGVAGFERLVVLKKMLPHLADHEEFVQMFLNEARLMARLSHPNIAQVYELGQVAGAYFIAMEYVRGVTLAEVHEQARLRNVRLPFPLGARAVAEICAALQYAYTCAGPDGAPLQIVHRDLSPHNVMVSFDGAVKLMDFGIAKAAVQGPRTRTGTVKGKFAYMSPEQIQGRPLDNRSDIFSAGILLYELTTTQRLFELTTEYDTIQDIVGGRLPSPRKRVRGYPRKLEQIYQRATAALPRKRYRDAREMQLDLERYLTGVSAPSAALGFPKLLAELFPTDSPRRQEPRDALHSEVLSLQQVEVTRSERQMFSPVATQFEVPGPSRRAVLIAAGLGVAALATGGLTWVWLAPRGSSTGPPAPGGPDQVAAVATPPIAPVTDLADAGGLDTARSSDAATLSAVDASPAPRAASTRTRGRDQRPRKPRPRHGKARPELPAPLAEARPAEEGTGAAGAVGYVTVTSQPWGHIRIGGRDYGQTPLAKIPLPAGEHRVEVYNPGTGKRQVKKVRVKAGQLQVLRFSLDGT